MQDQQQDNRLMNRLMEDIHQHNHMADSHHHIADSSSTMADSHNHIMANHNRMADSLTTIINIINIQGTHNNKEVGQDTLQDQPLVVAKAVEGAAQLVDRSMVTEVGDIHLETSAANKVETNEVELVGPMDKTMQLTDKIMATSKIKKKREKKHI